MYSLYQQSNIKKDASTYCKKARPLLNTVLRTFNLRKESADIRDRPINAASIRKELGIKAGERVIIFIPRGASHMAADMKLSRRLTATENLDPPGVQKLTEQSIKQEKELIFIAVNTYRTLCPNQEDASNV